MAFISSTFMRMTTPQELNESLPVVFRGGSTEPAIAGDQVHLTAARTSKIAFPQP
jgi:hypothetical protein